MPDVGELQEQYTMRIERLIVNDYPSEYVETLIECVAVGGSRGFQSLNMWTVNEPRVQGYLPSKVWLTDTSYGQHVIDMSFYCNSTLPATARPFGDGPMYVIELEVGSGVRVEYDVEARVFVDQLATNGGKIWYVFVFGEDAASKMFNKRKGDQNVL